MLQMKADSFSADWYEVVVAPSLSGIVSISFYQQAIFSLQIEDYACLQMYSIFFQCGFLVFGARAER